jgi:hypothetical protein
LRRDFHARGTLCVNRRWADFRRCFLRGMGDRLAQVACAARTKVPCAISSGLDADALAIKPTGRGYRGQA